MYFLKTVNKQTGISEIEELGYNYQLVHKINQTDEFLDIMIDIEDENDAYISDTCYAFIISDPELTQRVYPIYNTYDNYIIECSEIKSKAII